MIERPYALEVYNEDTETWQQWTTYIHREKAEARSGHLLGKGIISRVVEAERCPFCKSFACGGSASCLL